MGILLSGDGVESYSTRKGLNTVFSNNHSRSGLEFQLLILPFEGARLSNPCQKGKGRPEVCIQSARA